MRSKQTCSTNDDTFTRCLRYWPIIASGRPLLTWLRIGWRLRCQPVKSYIRKLLLVNSDFRQSLLYFFGYNRTLLCILFLIVCLTTLYVSTNRCTSELSVLRPLVKSLNRFPKVALRLPSFVYALCSFIFKKAAQFYDLRKLKYKKVF